MIKNFKKPFFIAEIGINHNGNLNTALKLIKAAKKAGYDAVKFQTYKASNRVKRNSPIFSILKKCELSHEEFIKIKKFCDKYKIIFFSTPFDEESAKFLNSINVKLFKIASFDITNLNLIKTIKKFNKPVIISTGMASKKEIDNVYKIFKNNLKNLIFLHCVSSYPCEETESNLKKISTLKHLYNCEIGLSDHTNGINTILYSRLLGANVFEKHFAIKKLSCIDKPVSINEDQSSEMIKKINYLDKVIGDGKIGIKKHELPIKQFRRFSK